jgi:hypothetical protein
MQERTGRTDIGYLLSDRYLDAWTFLLNDSPHHLFMLRGEINRRVNGGYRYSLDSLFLDLCTYSSNLVRINLKSAPFCLDIGETNGTHLGDLLPIHLNPTFHQERRTFQYRPKLVRESSKRRTQSRIRST